VEYVTCDMKAKTTMKYLVIVIYVFEPGIDEANRSILSDLTKLQLTSPETKGRRRRAER
jgi:hypothetical protein